MEELLVRITGLLPCFEQVLKELLELFNFSLRARITELCCMTNCW